MSGGRFRESSELSHCVLSTALCAKYYCETLLLLRRAPGVLSQHLQVRNDQGQIIHLSASAQPISSLPGLFPRVLRPRLWWVSTGRALEQVLGIRGGKEEEWQVT